MFTTESREDVIRNSWERHAQTRLSSFPTSKWYCHTKRSHANTYIQTIVNTHLNSFSFSLTFVNHIYLITLKLKPDEISWQKNRTTPNWSLKWINRNLTEMDWGFYQTWCSRTLIKSLPIHTYGVKFSAEIDLITKDEWSPLIMD